MSYKDTADTLASFRKSSLLQLNSHLTSVEIVIHTILCLRAVYPASTFTRRRAHGVAVYQSRHPAVRAYIARVVGAVSRELENARARRVSVVTKAVDTGVPLERFIIDFGYMPLEGVDTSAR
jgi:mitotic spindle assembly checkpoint protein MAD2B